MLKLDQVVSKIVVFTLLREKEGGELRLNRMMLKGPGPCWSGP